MKSWNRVAVCASIILLCAFSLFAKGSAEERPITRAEAASILASTFELADVQPLQIAGFEATAKNLGYTATNGAITSANVVAAAKDSTTDPRQFQIEAVINSSIMGLEADGLSFLPNATITRKQFSQALAKALYGPDLAIDHIALALKDKVITQADLSDDPLLAGQAKKLTKDLAKRLDVIALFATSDIHGNYMPYKSSDGNFQIGSVARIQTILNTQRSKSGEDHVLYVDGGDSPYNTTLANITGGDVSVAALGMLGLDATVLGNHDFDYSFANLLRLASEADYAMLSANTKYKPGHQGTDSIYPQAFGDYIIRDVNGTRIGIFGITDNNSAATTLYSNTADITWDNDLAKASQVVATLADTEKADVIVALSHLHSKNPALVKQESRIDISVGGGNDIAGKPTILGANQYLVNPGKHGEAITQVNINVLDGNVAGMVYNQIFLTEAYAEDPQVKALVDSYNALVDAALDSVIGYNSQDLPWSAALVRTQNSPIANLVTDALLAYFAPNGAQLCIVNGGGIRAKLDSGDVTIRNVTSVLPFDNNMMLVSASGDTIWKALENGISAYPSSNGKFPQVAGMTYSFKAGAPNTLLSVTLADGTPLDRNARYNVVINSFIAGGGDGYTMFNVLDDSKEMAQGVDQLVYVNKTYMRDALQQYMQQFTPSNPLVMDLQENRITIVE